MALTTERVKLFFEWFLFIAAIFIAITILYILLVLLFEVPRYMKELVRYLVEYLTRRRVWMQRTQLTEATGDVEIGRGIVEDRRDQEPAVIPHVSQVIPSQPNRRDDQGRRRNAGPMF
ncbi:movement protein [Banana bunchy top virus]|uniref:Movement protein n=1 Tax=Banana bunchy top virus TaxID=12585 RepID=A0A0R7FHQ6_BBTV|nr:movement protein [Banana bunchy top virus]